MRLRHTWSTTRSQRRRPARAHFAVELIPKPTWEAIPCKTAKAFKWKVKPLTRRRPSSRRLSLYESPREMKAPPVGTKGGSRQLRITSGLLGTMGSALERPCILFQSPFGRASRGDEGSSTAPSPSQGRAFLEWYSSSLLEHAASVVPMARQAFPEARTAGYMQPGLSWVVLVLNERLVSTIILHLPSIPPSPLGPPKTGTERQSLFRNGVIPLGLLGPKSSPAFFCELMHVV